MSFGFHYQTVTYPLKPFILNRTSSSFYNDKNSPRLSLEWCTCSYTDLFIGSSNRLI